MKHILKDFLKTAQTQIFGKQEEIPRSEKLELTSNAARKMLAWGLDTETIKLTFEIGERKWRKDKDCWQITRAYQYYSVGLWYVEEWKPIKGTKDVEKVCRVITCWKGRVRA
jgi:hypothetical protein